MGFGAPVEGKEGSGVKVGKKRQIEGRAFFLQLYCSEGKTLKIRKDYFIIPYTD
jgi:hypothetical protein